jgi:hypothetical protein
MLLFTSTPKSASTRATATTLFMALDLASFIAIALFLGPENGRLHSRSQAPPDILCALWLSIPMEKSKERKRSLIFSYLRIVNLGEPLRPLFNLGEPPESAFDIEKYFPCLRLPLTIGPPMYLLGSP